MKVVYDREASQLVYVGPTLGIHHTCLFHIKGWFTDPPGATLNCDRLVEGHIVARAPIRNHPGGFSHARTAIKTSVSVRVQSGVIRAGNGSSSSARVYEVQMWDKQ